MKKQRLAFSLVLTLLLSLCPGGVVQAASASPELPEGYVFIRDNRWELSMDGYEINIVASDGNIRTLCVDSSIAKAVGAERIDTYADGWSQNRYVGSFCQITSTDENGVVSELQPCELQRLTALDDGLITLGNGESFVYDAQTSFFCVDMFIDEGKDDTTALDDTLCFDYATAFSPREFFDPRRVEPQPKITQQRIADATKTYDSVDALVIPSQEDSSLASYVYVLRVSWGVPTILPRPAGTQTYTSGFDWDTLTAPGNYYLASSFAADAEYSINGASQADDTGLRRLVWDSVRSKPIPGAVVKVTRNDNNEITAVRATVYNVAQLTSDPEIRTSQGGTLQVRLPGVPALEDWIDAAKVSGHYQDMFDGDVALYYVDPDGVCVLEKAERRTGIVSVAQADGKLRIGTSSYFELARTSLDRMGSGYGLGVSTPDGVSSNQTYFTQWQNFEDEFDFYLDPNGDVCFTAPSPQDLLPLPTVEDDVALVLSAQWTGGGAEEPALNATLLRMDGTTQLVTVSALDGRPVGDLSGQFPGDKAANRLNNHKVDNDDLSATVFYNIKADDTGSYQLAMIEERPATLENGNWSALQHFTDAIIKNRLQFYWEPSNPDLSKNNFLADGQTVFLAARPTADGWEHFVYTGFFAVPEMEHASGVIAGVHLPTISQNFAKFVYLTAPEFIARPVTNVTLTPSSLSMTEGSTRTLAATVEPADAEDKAVSWTSNNTGVVTVDPATGLLTARKAGSATITVTTRDGDFTASCAVTVTAKNSGGGGSGGGGSFGGGGGGSSDIKLPATVTIEPDPSPSPKPTQSAQPTPASQFFSDVAIGAWYEPGITFVVSKGLFQGVAQGIFAPQDNMTRAMLMTVLARLDGQDTTGSQVWYQKGMEWAVSAGISDGTAPENNIDREQLAVMLYRYAKAATPTHVDLAIFPDGASVSPWAADAMAWAVQTGIITGKDGGYLDPQGVATRAEVAAMLQRYANQEG